MVPVPEALAVEIRRAHPRHSACRTASLQTGFRLLNGGVFNRVCCSYCGFVSPLRRSLVGGGAGWKWARSVLTPQRPGRGVGGEGEALGLVLVMCTSSIITQGKGGGGCAEGLMEKVGFKKGLEEVSSGIWGTVARQQGGKKGASPGVGGSLDVGRRCSWQTQVAPGVSVEAALGWALLPSIGFIFKRLELCLFSAGVLYNCELSEVKRFAPHCPNVAFDVVLSPPPPGCRYFEGGVSSVYLWDLDHGFAGVILIKKAGDGSKKIKGCWDSIHVVEVQVRLGLGGGGGSWQFREHQPGAHKHPVKFQPANECRCSAKQCGIVGELERLSSPPSDLPPLSRSVQGSSFPEVWKNKLEPDRPGKPGLLPLPSKRRLSGGVGGSASPS